MSWDKIVAVVLYRLRGRSSLIAERAPIKNVSTVLPPYFRGTFGMRMLGASNGLGEGVGARFAPTHTPVGARPWAPLEAKSPPRG